MLNYRLADEKDLMLYYEWANDPLVRQNSFTKGTIALDSHKKWFHQKISDKNSLMILFYLEKKAVGQCRIECSEELGKINFSVASEFRGMGMAKEILKLSSEIFFEKTKLNRLYGEVKNENIASQKAFLKAGFEQKEEATHLSYWIKRNEKY